MQKLNICFWLGGCYKGGFVSVESIMEAAPCACHRKRKASYCYSVAVKSLLVWLQGLSFMRLQVQVPWDWSVKAGQIAVKIDHRSAPSLSFLMQHC